MNKIAIEFCIVGAGIVGLAQAVMLGQQGFKVIVVERNDLSWLNSSLKLVDYDTRVFAINAASKALFESCGVWEIIERARVSPYEGMEVWDAQSNGYIEFSADNIYQSELGHIIEQKVILKALWDKIQSYPNITIIDKCELEQLVWGNEGSKLILKHPVVQHITAKLIIGADGGRSWVRQEAGIKTKIEPYNHSAIVATIKTEKPHFKIARQRFKQDGPLALLPLADPYHCSIVWSTLPSQASYLTQLSQEAFSEALTNTFGDKLGNLSLLGNTATFPLVMQHAKSYCLSGLVLVGDAAHVIHPLAGLGVNLGLRNVKTLSEQIIIQHNKGRSLSNLSYLRKYERQEKSHAQIVIAAMKAFKEGFGTENRLIKAARNIGLNFIDRHQLLKNQLIKLAIG